MRNPIIQTILSIILWTFFMMATTTAQPIVNKEALRGLKIYNEAAVNTANMESSPAFIGDKVAIVYTESKGKLFDKTIDQSFFQLGSCEVNLDNSLQPMKPYHKKINSELHEGPMSYDLTENKMYFTRSHREKRLKRGVEFDTFYLRIFTADLNLSNPVIKPININVDNYSVCHPTLSKDGQTMIFSSNQPGGHGKMDLYSAFSDGENWISITNLGPTINSNDNEVFPSLINDSLLIFSSNRLGGYGGLDLYVSKLEDGSWSTPELLLAPFNTPYDDLGMIVRENFKSGYFASNRQGGRGNDDIYRFESQVPIFGEDKREIVTAQIKVMDKLTLEPIPNAAITLTPLSIDVNNFTMSSYNIDMLSGKDPGDLILKLSPKKGKDFPAFYTKNDGIASFQIKRNQKFLINFLAEDYAPLNFIYDYPAYGSHVNIVLEPDDSDQKLSTSESVLNQDEGMDEDSLFTQKSTGDVVILDNIYFGYNSSNLDTDFIPELNALFKTMKKNSKMRIKINSHTDSRGTADYNLQLSINRASAVRDFLTSRDIDENRIEIKGYGESQLRNHCKDNVPCKEEEHRYNRRTEIVILEN